MNKSDPQYLNKYYSTRSSISQTITNQSIKIRSTESIKKYLNKIRQRFIQLQNFPEEQHKIALQIIKLTQQISTRSNQKIGNQIKENLDLNNINKSKEFVQKKISEQQEYTHQIGLIISNLTKAEKTLHENFTELVNKLNNIPLKNKIKSPSSRNQQNCQGSLLINEIFSNKLNDNYKEQNNENSNWNINKTTNKTKTLKVKQLIDIISKESKQKAEQKQIEKLNSSMFVKSKNKLTLSNKQQIITKLSSFRKDYYQKGQILGDFLQQLKIPKVNKQVN